MKCKTAYLIINPRGETVDQLSAMMAVLSAAGWKTDTAIREFGGHTRRLARKATEAGYDLVIGLGGDGTLNQVVNGVMAARSRGCIVGVIPGGTANVWAHEIGLSEDPVKASLGLINSEERKVDVGHVTVNFLPFTPGKGDRQPDDRQARPARHHFLLMAGLGLDAAILSRVPTSLKERLGRAAVAIAAMRTLPSQHTFAVEIWSSDTEGEETLRWRGEALQVIVGNTRRYGNFAEVTPNALIDDGALDVCVITAGNPLSTIEQVVSILLERNSVSGRSEHFRASHFCIRAPASIDLQLDGSRVKTGRGSSSDKTAHGQAKNPAAVTATYRFNAIPRALRMAIPRTYNGPLFENGSAKQDVVPVADDSKRVAKDQEPLDRKELDTVARHGRKVAVAAVGPDPERKTTYIVAGSTSEKRDCEPVAVRINRNTTLVGPKGEPLPVTVAERLPENAAIVVEGKRSKRGVVRAKRVVLLT